MENNTSNDSWVSWSLGRIEFFDLFQQPVFLCSNIWNPSAKMQQTRSEKCAFHMIAHCQQIKRRIKWKEEPFIALCRKITTFRLSNGATISVLLLPQHYLVKILSVRLHDPIERRDNEFYSIDHIRLKITTNTWVVLTEWIKTFPIIDAVSFKTFCVAQDRWKGIKNRPFSQVCGRINGGGPFSPGKWVFRFKMLGCEREACYNVSHLQFRRNIAMHYCNSVSNVCQIYRLCRVKESQNLIDMMDMIIIRM